MRSSSYICSFFIFILSSFAYLPSLFIFVKVFTSLQFEQLLYLGHCRWDRMVWGQRLWQQKNRIDPRWFMITRESLWSELGENRSRTNNDFPHNLIPYWTNKKKYCHAHRNDDGIQMEMEWIYDPTNLHWTQFGDFGIRGLQFGQLGSRGHQTWMEKAEMVATAAKQSSGEPFSSKCTWPLQVLNAAHYAVDIISLIASDEGPITISSRSWTFLTRQRLGLPLDSLEMRTCPGCAEATDAFGDRQAVGAHTPLHHERGSMSHSLGTGIGPGFGPAVGARFSTWFGGHSYRWHRGSFSLLTGNRTANSNSNN